MPHAAKVKCSSPGCPSTPNVGRPRHTGSTCAENGTSGDRRRLSAVITRRGVAFGRRYRLRSLSVVNVVRMSE